MRVYIVRNLVAVDQLANTLLGGHPDETLSARAYRADRNAKPLGRVLRPAIDALFLALTFGRDRQHCRGAYRSEVLRRQYPPKYPLDL